MWSYVSRIRYQLADHRWVARAIVALVAGVTAWTVRDALERVEAARAAWSDTSSVLVATRAIELGESLAELVEVREYPDAVVPDGALDTIDDEAVARRSLDRGEILVARDVEVDGDGVAARLDRGEAAVTVETRGEAGAVVGDRIAVVGDGVVLTELARVVARDETTVTLAASSDEAITIAGAVSSGIDLSLVVVPP